MKLPRRKFLSTLVTSGGLIKDGMGTPTRAADSPREQASDPVPAPHGQWRREVSLIDRSSLVKRHNPTLRKLDPLSPLSLGNGEFAFTADLTGLQTFPREYEDAMPLCTMSQWGWHVTPPPPAREGKTRRLTQYDTHGRMVGYQTSSEGQKELFDWLRENPHRLHLGQIGLRLTGAGPGEIGASDISDAEQQLDLWAGAITSRFTLRGKPVTVRTAVHPALDLLAVSVESELIREKLLAVRFAFPYGSPKMQAADWEKPGSHQSGLVNGTSDRADIRRTLDADEYHAAVSWAGGAKFSPEQSHTFLLNPSGTGARLEFVAAFSPRPSGASLPGVAATFAAARRHWERFWMTGGAVELAGSRDPRAAELERRVVLSQYLTAIQCAGSLPPQQPGLTSVFLAHSRRPRE